MPSGAIGLCYTTALRRKQLTQRQANLQLCLYTTFYEWSLSPSLFRRLAEWQANKVKKKGHVMNAIKTIPGL